MSGDTHDRWQLFKAKGKRFAWSACFLPADLRRQAALVYHFCRSLDDAVDLATDATAAANAHQQIVQAWQAGASPWDALQALCQTQPHAAKLMDALMVGVASDIGPVRIADEAALLRYAYRVAGTVGILMAQLFGIRAATILPFAVDLGIAFQLTNIARDVLVDARHDRIYLPATWLPFPQEPPQILAASQQQAVWAVVARLLDRANDYYLSVDRLLQAGVLPSARVAWVITLARHLYADIGTAMRYSSRRWHAGQRPLTTSRQLWRTVTLAGQFCGRCVGQMMTISPRVIPTHAGALHHHFQDLIPFENHSQLYYDQKSLQQRAQHDLR